MSRRRASSKLSLISSLISSSVSMQSAEKAGAQTAMFFLPALGQTRDLFDGVGLQPFFGPNFDWKVV